MMYESTVTAARCVLGFAVLNVVNAVRNFWGGDFLEEKKQHGFVGFSVELARYQFCIVLCFWRDECRQHVP